MKSVAKYLVVASLIAALTVVFSGVAFGWACNSQIGDYVWMDSNRDGLQDPDEVGVEGVQVDLYEVKGESPPVLLGTQTTDGDGRYLFTDILDDTNFYLEFTLPDGLSWTTQDAGDDAADSDVDANGRTAEFHLPCSAYDLTWDAGLVTQDQPEDHYTIEKTGTKVYGNCKTIGFWKNNVRKHLQSGGQGTQVSREDLLAWLGAVRGFYLDNPYLSQLPAAPEDALLQGALDVFNYTGSDIVSKTLRQLLACELNYVSGTYAMASPAAHAEVLRQAEDALQAPSNALYQIHDILDGINNLGEGSQDSTIYVGDTVAFTITVTADLSAERTVEVRDAIDSCLQVQAISNGGQYVASEGSIVWSLTLPAGHSETVLTFAATVTSLPNGDNSCDGPEGAIISDPVILPIVSGASVAASGLNAMCPTPPDEKDLINCAGLIPPTPPPPPPPPEDITITKTAEGGDALGRLRVGDSVLYTITVNSTLNAEKQVQVYDDLDSCLAVQEVSNGGTVDGQRVTWYVTLPTGTATTVFTIEALVTKKPVRDNGSGGPAGSLVSDPVVLIVLDAASSSSLSVDRGPSAMFNDNSDHLTNIAVLVPDVPPPPPPPVETLEILKSIQKVGGGEPYCIGDDILYTITVNATLNAARQVQVYDDLDSCLNVLQISNGGTLDGNRVTWYLTLPAGQSSAALTIKANITGEPQGDNGSGGPSGSLISDPVTVLVNYYGGIHSTSVTAQCHDRNLTNVAVMVPDVPPPPPPPPVESLEILKSIQKVGGDEPYCIGNDVLYTITVNATLNAAKQVQVYDDLDSCLNVLEISNGGTLDGNRVTWYLTLPAGQSSAALTIKANITGEPQGDNGTGGPSGSLISDPVTVLVNYYGGIHSTSVTAQCHDRNLSNLAVLIPNPSPPFVGPPTPPSHDDVLKIKKSAWNARGTRKWRVGDIVFFKIKVKAKVGADCTVEVRDYLDSSLQVLAVSDDGQVNDDNMVTWQVPFAAGRSRECLVIKTRIVSLPNGDNGCGEDNWIVSNTVRHRVSQHGRHHGHYRICGIDVPFAMCHNHHNSNRLRNCAVIVTD